jgi:arylsulfatase A-like enzyme
VRCRAGAALFLGALGCSAPAPERLPEGTSLLLVTLDTTRHDYVSAYGAHPDVSPHLAQLGTEGAVFLSAYAQGNVTNLSHLTLMTGLPALEHGVFGNLAEVPAGLDTLAEAFARKGYETAAFPAAPHVGEDFGWRGFTRLDPARQELDARRVTRRALAWLRARDAAKPFFAWVHYWDPHAPYAPPGGLPALFYQGDPAQGAEGRLRDRAYFAAGMPGEGDGEWLGEWRDPAYPRALYAAEVHHADRELGRVLRHLRREGLDSSVAVVVAGDHGESLGEHEVYYSHKGLFEPQVRVPFIVRLPGFPRGLRPPGLVTHLDLAPTLAALFALSLRHPMPGASLVPLLNGTATALPPRAVVHESAHNNAVALRDGRWKLILPMGRRRSLHGQAPQLFDLDADPGERRDLAGQESARVAAMSERLERWRALGRVRSHEHAATAEVRERLRALGYVE